jgi:hypothetical protein
MSFLIPALVTLLSNSGTHTQQSGGLPPIVVLGGQKYKTNYAVLLKNIDKVKRQPHFEVLEDSLLCGRQNNATIILVEKSYPPYQKLRFRKHIISLFAKYGVNKPFAYNELATPEFEPNANPMWLQSPGAMPNQQTKVTFSALLTTSLNTKGKMYSSTFAPLLKLDQKTKDSLTNAPCTFLSSPQEISEYAKSLVMADRHAMYHLPIDVPASTEVNMVRDALEAFGRYNEDEVAKLNEAAEAMLSDPIWETTKQRRKTKNMRDLRASIPEDADFIVNRYKGHLADSGQTVSSEELSDLDGASLSHQYQFSLVFCVNGKFASVALQM